MIDLDGTLVDSIPDLAAAANMMRAALGYPPLAVELIRTFVGKGIYDVDAFRQAVATRARGGLAR